MKYVLDASVAVKWAVPEADSGKALVLQDEFRNQVHELIAPDTFPIEIAHALMRAERRGILVQGEALPKILDIVQLGPKLHAYLPLLPRAAEISSQMRIGVYDCLYLALAEREDCEMLTADMNLVARAGQHFSIVLLTSL